MPTEYLDFDEIKTDSADKKFFPVDCFCASDNPTTTFVAVSNFKNTAMERLKFFRTAISVLSLVIMLMLSTTGCEKEPNDGNNDDLPSITGYPIVGTNQTTFYNNSDEISQPSAGQSFYGQNATYIGNAPSYKDNGNGTVTDLVTGLMWTQSPDMDGDGDIDYDDKMSYDEAVANALSFNLAGYTDWRLPTIKEQYSLIMFSGKDISPESTDGNTPFIDTDFFDFGYGDIDAGERIIDAQFATSTLYVSTTMDGNETMFGVNFADGRIKGYPTSPMPGQTEGKQFYVLYVRGNTTYGINDYADNGDGTITDNATGLMWMQEDSGTPISWENALSYAENFEFAGYSDWRLPDAKELQSIVDYSRSPSTSGTAAIDPLFSCTQIENEAGQADFAFYWTSTTHADSSPTPGGSAAYVSFGRALGYMFGEWIDVHGAGAQRSDPKEGDPNIYPYGFGPQGDAIRINNFVRLVRNVGN